MGNIVEEFNQRQVADLTETYDVPEFKAGDTVRVNVRIIEGTTERIQAFEGVCIARKNRGLASNFIVRKISNGEGVERTFPLYSPRIDSIKVVRRGVVRRAKLFYLRERSGKSARIREKIDFTRGSAEAKAAKKAKKAPAKDATKAEGDATKASE